MTIDIKLEIIIKCETCGTKLESKENRETYFIFPCEGCIEDLQQEITELKKQLSQYEK